MSNQATVPILYVGRKEREQDHLYGTGIVWLPGEVKDVPADKAPLLLRHTDVWIRADVQEKRNEKRMTVAATASRVSRAQEGRQVPWEAGGGPQSEQAQPNTVPTSPSQPPSPPRVQGRRERRPRSSRKSDVDRRRKPVDWEAIRADYLAGIKRVRRIAVLYGISAGRISQVAKREGWVYGALLPRIRAEAKRMVEAELVRQMLDAERAKRGR
jgi:hypothetical protein